MSTISEAQRARRNLAGHDMQEGGKPLAPISEEEDFNYSLEGPVRKCCSGNRPQRRNRKNPLLGIGKNKKNTKGRNCNKKLHIQSDLSEDSTMSSSLDNDINFIARWESLKDQLYSICTINGADDTIDYIESVVLFCITAYNCDSWVGITSSALQCLKTIIKAPVLLKTIAEYLYAMDREMEPHMDVDSPMSVLKTIRTNWNLFKSNKMYSQFSKLMGLLVNVGLCDASRLDFTIKGFRMFDKDLAKKTANSFDIFDAIFDTVIYFVEGTWQCYKTGSLLPLLVEDYNILSLDDRYNKIISLWSLQESGNMLLLSKVTVADFDYMLEALIADFVSCSHTAKGIDKTLINNKLTRLLDIKVNFSTQQICGSTKRAPFVLEYFGRSNQGKSTIQTQITTCLLKSQGLCIDMDRRKNMKPSEKFDDVATSSDIVHIYDDVANVKPTFVTKPHTEKIIEENNNVMTTANKAELAGKGKTFMATEINNYTTNIKHLDAWDYSNCPYSIQRRMNYVITVRCKKQFQAFGGKGRPIGLDAGKVNAWRREFVAKYNFSPPFDDVWDLDIEIPVQPDNLREVADYEPVVHNGKSMTMVSTQEVVEFLIEKFAIHRREQMELIERMNTKVPIDLCGIIENGISCPNMKGLCSKHLCDGSYKSLAKDPTGQSDDDSEVNVADSPLNAISKVAGRFKRGFQGRNKAKNNKVYKPPPKTGRRELGDTTPRQNDDSALMNDLGADYVRPTEPFEPHADLIDNFDYQRRHDASGNAWHPTRNPSYINTEVDAVWSDSIPDFGEATRLGDYFGYAFFSNLFFNKINKFGKQTYLRTAIKGEQSQVDFFIKHTTSYLEDWTPFALVPEELIDNKAFQWFVYNYFGHHYLLKYFKILEFFDAIYKKSFFIGLFLLPFMIVNPSLFYFYINFIIMYPVFYCMKYYIKHNLHNKVVKLLIGYDKPINTLMRVNVTNGRERLLMTCVAIAALYNLGRLYKFYKGYFGKPQGNITSVTPESIVARDKEKNVYSIHVPRPLPITPLSKTVSHDILCELVKGNLMFAEIKDSNTKSRANVLFLAANVYILPYHYLLKYKNSNITFYRNNPNSAGGKFTDRIDDNFVRIEGTDLCVIYTAKGGSFKDLTKHFVDGRLQECPFTMIYRKEDSEFISPKGRLVPGSISHTALANFSGGTYSSLDINTFPGLCGAVLVSDTRGCVILGIHVAGLEGTPKGGMATVDQAKIIDAMSKLEEQPGILLTRSNGLFSTQMLGVQILTDAPLTKRSCFRFENWPEQPEQVGFSIHGSCVGAYTAHSDFTMLPMSSIIAEVCGVPCKWTGPKFNPVWFGYQKCIKELAFEAQNCRYDLLTISVNDYLKPLLSLLTKQHWTTMKPLNPEENALGIPGQKFMDAIKRNTSIGFPLSGPKINYMVEIEPTEAYPHNFVFTEEIMDEIERVDNIYRSGERAYLVAKACKKDEVVKGQKCRIFYANSIAMTWCVRKYFLPIIRFLSMNPLVSECAVGINCHSQEFDQLYKFANKYPNLFGGDYSSYDQRLPTQKILAAFYILIEIAKRCEYSDIDILAMKGIASDIAYALVSFDGTLIQFNTNGHISGNSLTVYINGICGSLNLRDAFFSNNPNISDFRSHVSAMTYGDDNIGSYSKKCKFGIDVIAECLAPEGQIYTMPDKSAVLQPTLNSDEFEFLKRKPNYIPEIDCYVGAIQEDSIFKSLHCGLRGKHSPITVEELCGQNIDTALLEWFNHGRDKYEFRRAQMKEVAERLGYTNKCATLDRTFDERVQSWKDTYIDNMNPTAQAPVPIQLDYGVDEEY